MAKVDPAEEIQQVTVRMPRELHEALRTLSLATDRSMNEIVTGALRNHLAEEGHREAVEAFFTEARETYKVALEKLEEL